MSEARASDSRTWPNAQVSTPQPSLANSPSTQMVMPARASLPGSALLQATAAATAASKSRPQLKVTTSQAIASAVHHPRRVWVKRAGMTPTSLMVDPEDLVDDLKVKVLAKYPTSLLRTCDPADLVVAIPGDVAKMLRTPATSTSLASPSVAPRKLSTSSSSRPRASSLTAGKTFKSPLASPQAPSAIELEPDELIVPIIDKYFPEGMSMSEALEIFVSNVHPGHGGASSLSSAVSIPRAGGLAGSGRVRAPSSMAPPPLPSSSTQTQSTAATIRPKLMSSPSSSQLVKRAMNLQSEKKPADTTQDTASSGGVLLLPRQLTLSMKKDAVVKSESASQAPQEQKDGDQKQEGLLELRQMYKKLPSTQASVVVPQVNVLIVEDNEINQKILETALRRNKVRCSIAKNGRDAVAKWREGGFHIILMDLQLPVMSGLEASKEIRRLETVNRIGAFSATSDGKKPPAAEDAIDHKLFKSPVIIVALTASSSAEDRSEALRAGCNDFLTKPVNLEWLQQKLLEWGCMQALIDFEGWKSWYVLDSGTPKASNSIFRKQAAPAPPAPPEIQRPQSPRVPTVGRSGRALDNPATRSRSSSTRRS